MAGRKAGVISIDVNAGTAKFLVDMDKANAKIAQFGQAGTAAGTKAATGIKAVGDAGHASVSGVQAASGAIRLLEGNITNNVRAV